MGVRRWLVAVWFVALAPVLVSCSSSDDTPAATTTEPVTVEEVLADAAAAMALVDSVTFELEGSGAELAVEGLGELAFTSAEGHYVAPSSADALIDVSALGLSTQVGITAIDGWVWITNPLTGQWEDAPAGLSFDPAVLFDEQDGLPALLRDGLDDPELVEGGPDGEGRRHVRGAVSAERLAGLTAGLLDQPTEVALWIDAETDRVVEAHFDVAAGGREAGSEGSRGAGEAGRLVLTLRDYGEPVTIEAPEAGSEP